MKLPCIIKISNLNIVINPIEVVKIFYHKMYAHNKLHANLLISYIFNKKLKDLMLPKAL